MADGAREERLFPFGTELSARIEAEFSRENIPATAFWPAATAATAFLYTSAEDVVLEARRPEPGEARFSTTDASSWRDFAGQAAGRAAAGSADRVEISADGSVLAARASAGGPPWVLRFEKSADGWALRCSAPPPGAGEAPAAAWAATLGLFLRAALSRPDAPVLELDVLSSEHKAAARSWDDTERPYAGLCFPALFDSVAAAHPSRPAVFFGEETVSFGELSTWSDRVAVALRRRGVGPGAPVGVLLPRSPRTIAALLGLWKAGAAYVPLDVDAPAAHVRDVLRETGARLALTDGTPLDPSALGEAEALPWGSLESEDPALKPTAPADPDGLAAVFPTSGSTGKPKAVAVTFRSLANRFQWMWEAFPFEADETSCQRTPVTFLPSLWEMLGGLLRGAPLAMATDAVVRDPEAFAAFLSRHGVTRAGVVPSLLKMLLDKVPDLGARLPRLRLWLLAGEVLPAALLRRLRAAAPRAVVHNDYGATEVNGVLAYDSRWDAPLGVVVPSGRPIANAQTRVLNARRVSVPLGGVGELHVGGTPLGPGYLGRPDLTAERFKEIGGARFYATGDLARQRPDGLIEVLGRRDQQVKIQGKRVDLAGVERVLAEHPAVALAAAVARTSAEGVVHAEAFVTPRFAARPPAEELRAHLRARLPDFMVPSRISWMEELPRTPGGKIDRIRLAAAEVSIPAPAAAVNGTLCGLLRGQLAALLGKPLDDIDDQVPFMDQGLQSMDAVAWTQKLREALGREVSVTVIFDHFSIERLARHLAPEAVVAASPVPGPRPPSSADVAVVGLSGRFPGAPDAGAFWRMLQTARGAIAPWPEDRGETASAGSDGRRGGALADADRFDAAFFRISGEEARRMDPQHRLALQEAWRALEDAGLPPRRLEGRTVGVFVGARDGGHAEALRRAGVPDDADTLAGNDPAALAGRLSHALGLRGPCLAVDTACSSALAAVHLACRALAGGECDAALAGAVCVLSSDKQFSLAASAGMLSARGRCLPFDRGGDGFLLAEAVGFLVLKPLAAALRDGDPVYGVVKATSLRHGGGSMSLTAPSKAAQVGLFRETFARAGVPPESVTLVEAHAAGTHIGDLMELEALAEVHGAAGPGACALGAAKALVGHANAAAGLAGLFKALLCLRHATLVPEPADPSGEPLSLAGTPFFRVDAPRPWTPPAGLPRRAAVNAFGYAGANAQILLEEAPPAAPSAPVEEPRLFVLSAKTDEALAARAAALAGWLETDGRSAPLDCLARTLFHGREHFSRRIALTARDAAGLARALRAGPVAAPVLTADESARRLAAWRSADSAGSSRGIWLTEAAALYTAGALDPAAPAPENLFDGTARVLEGLPGYPFEGGRYRPGGAEEAAPPAEKSFTAPRSAVEARVAAIWREVLGVAEVGVDDGFMALGGSSAQMIQAHHRLREVFETDLSLVDAFFKYSTVAALAERLAGAGAPQTQQAPSAPPARRRPSAAEQLSRRRLLARDPSGAGRG